MTNLAKTFEILGALLTHWSRPEHACWMRFGVRL